MFISLILIYINIYLFIGIYPNMNINILVLYKLIKKKYFLTYKGPVLDWKKNLTGLL